MVSNIISLSIDEKPIVVVFSKDDKRQLCQDFFEEKGFIFHGFDPDLTAVPALLRPDYVYYFISGSNWASSFRYLSETLDHLKQYNSRINILGVDLDPAQKSQLTSLFQSKHLNPKCVDLITSSIENLTDALDYLFLPEAVGSWKSFSTRGSFAQLESVTQVKVVKRYRPNLKRILSLIVLVLVIPIIYLSWLFGPAALATKDLLSVKSGLETKNLDPNSLKRFESSLGSAQEGFSISRERLRSLTPLSGLLGLQKDFGKLDGLLSLGEHFSSALYHGLVVTSSLEGFAQGIFNPESPTFSIATISSVRPELEKLEQDLGFIDAQLDQTSVLNENPVLSRLNNFTSLLNQSRRLVRLMYATLPYWDEILGQQSKKTYLLAFQNPAELRPSGGFLGSFGLVTFDKGKLLTFNVYDIYSADGQLKIHVAPPDEILHHLGQPNWYMRDANWSADFALTSKRLEWFLEKEMGISVDGVIGVDLHFVEKLLTVTGPVDLLDLGEQITSSNLFEKAEFRSEIKFFPGSTQKSDFLGASANAIIARFESGRLDNPKNLISALSTSLESKNIQFYFNNPSVQTVMENQSIAGILVSDECLHGIYCLSSIDANLGANKANYYISRVFNLKGAVSKGGDLNMHYEINFINDSPSNTWPGGNYKNYLRVYIPYDSVITKIDIGDTRIATLSAGLTADILKKLPLDRFLVKIASESSQVELGMLVEVPVKTSKRVYVDFTLPSKVSLNNETTSLKLKIIKQAGTVADPFGVSFEYPTFIKLTDFSDSANLKVVNSSNFSYNTKLDKDLLLGFKFSSKKL